MSGRLKISVAVATFGRPGCLRRCLASLAVQERPADEVIVVAQGDDAASGDVARELITAVGAARLKLIYIPVPNIAAAENTAVTNAEGDIVAFLDDDAAAPSTWLAGIEAWFKDAAVGGVGGPYVEHRGGIPQRATATRVGAFTWFGRYVSRQWCYTASPQKVDVLAGSNMSFRRALIPVIPTTFRPYWHAFEVYISLGVRRQGFNIIFDPTLAVDHFREEGARYYDRIFGAAGWELARCIARNNAHNFVFAALSNLPRHARVPFIAYDFLVGDSGRPGLLRAGALAWEGRRAEARRLVPSLLGRWEGIRSFFAARRAGAAANHLLEGNRIGAALLGGPRGARRI